MFRFDIHVNSLIFELEYLRQADHEIIPHGEENKWCLTKMKLDIRHIQTLTEYQIN